MCSSNTGIDRTRVPSVIYDRLAAANPLDRDSMHTSTDRIAGDKSTKSKANRIEIELAIAYHTRSTIIISSCWNVFRVASMLRYRLQKYLDHTERRKHSRRIAQLSHRRCTFIGDSKAIRTTRGKRSTEFSNVAFPSLGCSIYFSWKERKKAKTEWENEGTTIIDDVHR